MRIACLLAAVLTALCAASARAQSLTGMHDILGEDPLAREIRQASVTSVTWVAGPNGAHVPVRLGAAESEQPLSGTAAAASGLSATGSLTALSPAPGLA